MRLLALALILAACSVRSPASALSPQPQQQEVEAPAPVATVAPYSAVLLSPTTGGVVLLDGAGKPLAAFAYCGDGQVQGPEGTMPVMVFCTEEP